MAVTRDNPAQPLGVLSVVGVIKWGVTVCAMRPGESSPSL